MDTAMIASLDKQINELMQCKPLTEAEVSQLCKKVRMGQLCLGVRALCRGAAACLLRRRARCSSTSPTC